MILRTSLFAPLLALLYIASPLSLSAASISGSVRAPSGDVSADFPSTPFFPGFESVNLTAKGSIDWLEAGTSTIGDPPGFVDRTATNFKTGGTAIGALTITTPGIGISGDSGGSIFKTWTDGTPRLADNGDGNEVLTDGSFSFDVAATAATSHLDVFTSITTFSLTPATGLFTATLEDSGNNVLGIYTQSVTSDSPTNIFGVDFSGAGDHVAVAYSFSSGNGKVGFEAATLSVVPEPASIVLAALGFVALAWGWRRQVSRAVSA
jgi:hypothetical protein